MDVSLFVKAQFWFFSCWHTHAHTQTHTQTHTHTHTHHINAHTHTTHIEKLSSPVWNLFVLMRAIMLVLLVLMLLVLMLAIMLVQDMRLRPLIHHPCLPKEDKFSKHKGAQKCQED
jgi:hypothetical protein